MQIEVYEILECQKRSSSLHSALGYQGQCAVKSWNNLHKEKLDAARDTWKFSSQNILPAAMSLRKGIFLKWGISPILA